MAIILSRQAVLTIQRELRLYPNVETGGVLFGRKTGRLWMITRVSPSGQKSIRSEFSFEMDAEELEREAENVLGGTILPCHVLGLWHKHNHNYSPCFSEDDQTANYAYAQLNKFGAISILASKTADSGYIFRAFHVSSNNACQAEKLFGL